MLNIVMGAIMAATSSLNLHSSVRATYYGPKFEGKTMANGKKYNPRMVSLASNDYKLGTLLRIMNPMTGKGLYVRVTDRTARTKHNHKVIDLSEKAFDALGLNRKKGWGWVNITEIEEAAVTGRFGYDLLGSPVPLWVDTELV